MEVKQLRNRILQLLPQDQVFTDELSRLVKGTDAGLYRLIPKAVVRVYG
jgi:D-lactate dehydrogenase